MVTAEALETMVTAEALGTMVTAEALVTMVTTEALATIVLSKKLCILWVNIDTSLYSLAGVGNVFQPRAIWIIIQHHYNYNIFHDTIQLNITSFKIST